MYEPDKERENKRWHQAFLTSRLDDQCVLNPKLKSGDILILSGPNPKEAIKYYKKYKMYKWCHLVEKDAKTFEIAKSNFDRHGNEILMFDDIFLAAYRLRNELRGIDFDFCTTLKEELSKEVVVSMVNLQKPCVWFRITSSHRRITKTKLESRQQKILKAIENLSDYIVTDEVSINYKDGGPMNTWQVILRNNRKMEAGTMRTLKEMTLAEKDMARTLVEYKYSKKSDATYDDADISRVLQMSPYSVSALKAHVTMRNNGY